MSNTASTTILPDTGSHPHGLEDKLARAREILRELGSVAVAFSAGVDSTFVLKLAVDTLGRENVLAVTGVSGSLARREFDEAAGLARSIGAEHLLLETREFEDSNYLANPTNRCYYCKTELYTRMGPILAERHLAAIVSGTNADDLGDYRPGLAAAGEHRVRAPLAESGLTKSEVRELSCRLGLPTHDKPASPCLSSRVQYGESITPEKLRAIEQGEIFLRELGIRECRVRHHDQLARLEVPPEWIPILMEPATRSLVDARFRELGYHYVTIDLRGFRSGSMNEVIAFGKRQGS